MLIKCKKDCNRKENTSERRGGDWKYNETLNCIFFTSRDSLEPILEKYNITFESHSLFLDSSNTPLPLAFETFPLSGSILHVRGASVEYKSKTKHIHLLFYLYVCNKG